MRALNIIVLVVFVVFSGNISAVAQENENIPALENMTTEQKQLLQQQQELLKENREAFKASLTKEQRDILTNKEFTKEQRYSALARTYSANQKEMMAQNREKMRAIKEAFRSTITAEQRQAIRMRLRQNKDISSSTELRERIRRHRKKRRQR